nr:MAG TPA: hypothetical protein [Caudoviricetes sp.]
MLSKIIRALLNTRLADYFIDKYLKEQSAIKFAKDFIKD